MADKENDGVLWLVARRGTRRVDRTAAAQGRLRFTGEYWQGTASQSWGPITTARYYTSAEREIIEDSFGVARADGEWIPVFVNVDPAGAAD